MKKRTKPEPEKTEPGIRCPRCHCGHCPVQFTRQQNKRTLRRRQCRCCGRAFSTYER